MTQRKHFKISSQVIRNELDRSIDLADQLHTFEKNLIQSLSIIDQERYYVRYGYKSLMGFCNHALYFSKTQSQRLVTQVRRYEPTENIQRKTADIILSEIN